MIFYLIISSIFLYSGFAEASSDYQLISDMIRSVSAENLMDTVLDLQHNYDETLDKYYESRYCLRVSDASDPSDGACDNAAGYIFKRFASYGLDVEYDAFIYNSRKNENYRMRNVVATLPGKGPGKDRTYIVCSHYDSIAGLSAGWLTDWKSLPAPGADDNASGTSALIEIARILSLYDFNFTIKFIAFSCEEFGMFGSKNYARNAQALKHKIAGVINLDMIGYDPNSPDIDIITNYNSQWLANAILNANRTYNINFMANKSIDPSMVYSDHSPFWKSGYDAIMITESSDSDSEDPYPFRHTANDTVDKLNFDMMLNTTRLVIAALAQLADPISGDNDGFYADLSIEPDSIRFSDLPSQKGSYVSVSADFRNLGENNADNVNIQLSILSPETDASPEILREWSLSMKPGILYSVSAPIRLDNWGDYSVIFRLNTDFGVKESYFGNNTARKILYISAGIGIEELAIYPNPASSDDGVNLRYRLSQDSRVTISIYDIAGNIVYTEVHAPGSSGGRRGPNSDIKWDCTNMSHKKVASGIYICLASASNENGKGQTISKKLSIIY